MEGSNHWNFLIFITEGELKRVVLHTESVLFVAVIGIHRRKLSFFVYICLYNFSSIQYANDIFINQFLQLLIVINEILQIFQINDNNF